MVAAGTSWAGAGVILGHQLWGCTTVFRFPDLSFRLDHAAFPLACWSAPARLPSEFSAPSAARRAASRRSDAPGTTASYRPALVERTGIAAFSRTRSHRGAQFERKTSSSALTIVGLALATAS